MHRWRAFVLFLVLGLVVAGCGTGGGGDSRAAGDDDGTGPPPPGDDDNLADDDSAADDDSTADDDSVDDDSADDDSITPECGMALDTDLVLNQDLDCTAWYGDSVVFVAADNVTLDCANHRISGPGASATNVVYILQQNQVTVRNCEITGGVVGIAADGSSDIHLLDNVIHQVDGVAIRLNGANVFEIAGNEAYNDGAMQNGIDMVLSSGGTIADNIVHDFGMGGIQFLGSHDCLLENNLVYNIHDTGFGFFWDSASGEVTHDIEVTNNEVRDCYSVGANEIMHASHHLTFTGNSFHDVAAIFFLYQSNGGAMHDIVIEDNQLTDATVAISIADNTESVAIHGNEITGCASTLRVESTQNLVFGRNQIDQANVRQRKGDAVFAVADSSGVTINHNIVTGGDELLFAVASGSPDVDLSENYWNGCPFLDDFLMVDAEVLDVVNPINTLECYEVDNPYTIVDADEDGWDDAMCVPPTEVQCI